MREGTNRPAGGLMCVTVGGGCLIGTHQALFKDFSPEGGLVHHRTRTHTHHVCDEEGRRVKRVGHLRLFKQISGEYQSPRPLRETLSLCPPAAEAFVSPSLSL